MENDIFIFDCEVFAHDWLFVFKEIATGEYTVIHNDNDAVVAFMERNPFLGGFNNKHYDNFILKGVMCGLTPEQIKEINDLIIVEEVNGWDIPVLREYRVYFDSFDLMDDCQVGLSLKAIEAHLGIPIEETEVDFNITHRLSEKELQETIYYCKYDVDATEKLYHLRQAYLKNKVTLGKARNLTDRQAMYMTNAKLTSVYLKAQKPEKPWNDERNYQYPEKLLRQYIPQEVFDFFDCMKDDRIPNDELFSSKLEIMVGVCPCTIAYGGIHGAIPTYVEEATETRTIRNKDVTSYYSHLMTLMGYCSRNMPSPKMFEDTLEERVAAKKAGDKATANALKLVLNTTYGAMLNGKDGTAFNDLYDPLMGRSVCISGQLFLLELSEHLIAECPTLKIIQLNTDGIMVSFDHEDEAKYQEITQEWQDRTGFELEEDFIRKIVQKDVNNYVEVPADGGEPKVKGGQLVRGIAPAGAFNINNNAVVVARAIKQYFIDGTPPEETIAASENILDFQLIAKAGGKYSQCYHLVGGEKVIVQKVNRVYAVSDKSKGTVYKTHAVTGRDAKVAGLPTHCAIDNNNNLSIEVVDRKWYVKLAKKYINDFLGIKPPRKNTRRINSLKKKSLALFD
ncbi:MAG: DNA polymerase elongation subunit (family B) [Acutalibacteraceae bacterium]|nr:DNA polymerase elongation subunit (family B) [Subdoligranulum variabile]